MRRYMEGISILIAILLLLLGTIWLGRSGNVKRRSCRSRNIFRIETSHPLRRDFSSYISCFGKVVSKRKVGIISLTDGRIVDIKVRDGSFVKRGEILFVIGGQEVRHKIRMLKKRINLLKREESILKRIVHIKKEAVRGRIAKREDLLLARQSLLNIEADLASLKEELPSFKDSLIIRSPIDGIFLNRKVCLGQDIEKGMHFADVISRDIRIIAYLFPPQGVRLSERFVLIELASGEKLKGRIVNVIPEKDLEGATIIWIEGKEINGLVPGEYVSGTILLKTHRGVLSVPKEAVVQDENGNSFVFVKKKKGYEKRKVRIGMEDGKYCEISGISEKDEVVVKGAYELLFRKFAKTFKVPD